MSIFCIHDRLHANYYCYWLNFVHTNTQTHHGFPTMDRYAILFRRFGKWYTIIRHMYDIYSALMLSMTMLNQWWLIIMKIPLNDMHILDRLLLVGTCCYIIDKLFTARQLQSLFDTCWKVLCIFDILFAVQSHFTWLIHTMVLAIQWKLFQWHASIINTFYILRGYNLWQRALIPWLLIMYKFAGVTS